MTSKTHIFWHISNIQNKTHLMVTIFKNLQEKHAIVDLFIEISLIHTKTVDNR